MFNRNHLSVYSLYCLAYEIRVLLAIPLLEDRSPMPYLFDVIDGTLEHTELAEHIQWVGIVIFDKSGRTPQS